MDVTLARLPNPGALIASAVMNTPTRPSPRAGLPDRRVSVRGVEQPLGRLAAYNRLCGFGLRDVVPATWIHVLAFPLQTWLMGKRDFPFPLVGIVHVSNTIQQFRGVNVTERLDLTCHADNLAPHRRGVTFDLACEARVGDDLVWRGVSNYLARGASLGEPVPDTGAPERPEPPPVTGRWRLPADLGRRYADVSGDINPIHLSRVSAMPFGFKRPIVHGMWTFARALAALDGRLPAAYRVDGRFVKPILLPARADFGEARDEAGYRIAVTNRDGKPYFTAVITRLASDAPEPSAAPAR